MALCLIILYLVYLAHMPPVECFEQLFNKAEKHCLLEL